ncbi:MULTISPECIES: hypothetical protein [Halorubrum]|uniref:hypothetical protein n=1 Tax=Halorubrum TaxID=56688 RepID=UPI0006776832|nr:MULTISPECIES: hypothetical protein [Halorubrum]
MEGVGSLAINYYETGVVTDTSEAPPHNRSLTPPQPRRRLPMVAADSLARATRALRALAGTRHRTRLV